MCIAWQFVYINSVRLLTFVSYLILDTRCSRVVELNDKRRREVGYTAVFIVLNTVSFVKFTFYGFLLFYFIEIKILGLQYDGVNGIYKD